MVRKTLLILAVVTLVPLALLAQEMTLDEVLSSHYEALGGLDTLRAVQSAVMTGTMTMGPGMEAPFTMIFKRPKKARLEFTMQGMTGVQAFDGETAWAVMPFLGKDDPEVMAEDQAKNMAEQADFDGPLVDWEEKGHQLELLGLDETEGTEAVKLKVTLANGDVRYHFLDSEYYIIIKLEGSTTIQGNETEFESILSDYKEVGGLMFPHSIENKAKGAPSGQVITIENIELNSDLSDDIFKMPEKAPAAPEGTE